MNKKISILLLLMLATIGLVFVSCNKDKDDDDQVDPVEIGNVTIVKPANNATVSGIVEVEVLVDNEQYVDYVKLLIDGASIDALEDDIPPFKINWDTDGLSEGPHTIIARAFPDEGDPVNSDLITINYELPLSLPMNGLVAAYGFNETSNFSDLTGHGHNGAIYGATYTPNGIMDGAFSFDGVDDDIVIPDHDNLSFGDGSNDGPFSISGWIYVENFDDKACIISKSGTIQYTEWHLTIGSSGNIVYQLRDDGAEQYIRAESAPGAVSTGAWQHIVGTYDGSSSETGLEVYLNGVNATLEQSSKGTYIAAHNTVSDVYVGHLYPDNAAYEGYTDGRIDQILIYNRVLTQDEITTIYNGGNGIPYSN